MRTEIAYYYNSSGKNIHKRNLYEKLKFRKLRKLLQKIDIGSEQWIELQYQLSMLSSSTFHCELRELFYKKSCLSCGDVLCVMPYSVMSYAKNISLGERVYINSFSMLVAKDKITIGNNVLIGPHVIINSGMHNYINADLNINKQGHSTAPIIIEDDVWIGANSIILPGVTIGKGAVIGANSLVNKNVESYSIVGGTPAKIIKNRVKE